MIPGIAETRRSLDAAFDLLRGRAEAVDRFDLTVEGFWRSFGALAFILPPGVVLALVNWPQEQTAGGGFASYMLSQMTALIADWLALPLLLALVARQLGIASRYTVYVIARNWMTVGLTVAAAVLGLVSMVLGGVAAGLISLALIALLLRWHYVVVRTTLMAGPGFAISLVLLDLLLSLVIDVGTDRLLLPELLQ